MRDVLFKVAVMAATFGAVSVALGAPAYAEDRACDAGSFCVYDKNNYGGVTVWVPRGASYARAQANQTPNKGNSNRGLSSSSATC